LIYLHLILLFSKEPSNRLFCYIEIGIPLFQKTYNKTVDILVHLGIYLYKKGDLNMKIPQAAKELNRHPRTIKRWIQSGLIKAVKIGRDWEVPESEVIRLKGGK
jgi:excisionase family DNA binding protein